MDDHSEGDWLGEGLDELVKDIPKVRFIVFLRNVTAHSIQTRIMRLPSRVGLIRAKVEGAKAATGDVILFLDRSISLSRVTAPLTSVTVTVNAILAGFHLSSIVSIKTVVVSLFLSLTSFSWYRPTLSHHRLTLCKDHFQYEGDGTVDTTNIRGIWTWYMMFSWLQ